MEASLRTESDIGDDEDDKQGQMKGQADGGNQRGSREPDDDKKLGKGTIFAVDSLSQG